MSRNDEGTAQGGMRGTLSHALERNQVTLGVPLAVEFTFRAPDVAGEEVRKLPLSVGLAIDRSGSMEGAKLHSARDAAWGVLNALQDGERFAAVAFDTAVLDISPSVRLDRRTFRGNLRQKIECISSGGSTALFDGFARAAELVALGTDPRESDSWVIVLSDGMGNHGLTDPPTMRTHASALADRGIRTITIGIGDDYEAAQLTALSEGGGGAFHHASFPNEIVEIVLGELHSLRQITVRDFDVHVTVRGAHRFSLLGGEVLDEGSGGRTHFARVSAGRTVRIVGLVWPRYPLQVATLEVDARWTDQVRGPDGMSVRVSTQDGPVERDIELAQRAARLWHARIVETALEMNDAGQFEKAAAYVQRWERRFGRYVVGVPGTEELLMTLATIGRRVQRQWGTAGHKEAYVMARKAMLFEDDARFCPPMSYSDALERDNQA